MKRLVLCLLLWAPGAWAVDLCSVVSIGPGASTSGSSITPTLPASFRAGDLLLFYSTVYNAGATLTTAPVGYTQLDNDSATNVGLWGKLATASESSPSITWSSTRVAGFIVAVRNPGGFPASVVGDISTGSTGSSDANQHYRLMTVTQGGGCTFQFAKKLISSANGTATGVVVTSGYVAAGFATSGTTTGIVVSAQMFNGDATAPDVTNNNEVVTGNTTAGSSRSQTLTLLSGDVAPTAFTFTDVTDATISTQYTSDEKTVAGITNYAQISSSLTCQYNVNGGAFTSTAGMVGVGDTFSARVTSSGSPATAEACVVTVGSVSDTYTVTTAAAGPPATDGPPILLIDIFTDADDTSIESHTPDVDEPANGWTISGIWTGQAPAVAEIVDDTLRIDAQTAVITDTEYRDHVVDVSWTPQAAQSNGVAVVLRYTDNANWWVCRYSETNGTMRLVNRVTNVDTAYGSAVLGSQPYVEDQTYRLTGFAVGDVVGCMLDGVLKVSATGSTFNTVTKAGVAAESATVAQVFDDLMILRGFSSILTDTGNPADDPLGFFLGENPAAGSAFWADPTDPPDQTYVAWMMFDGGSWQFTPETSFEGSDVWGVEGYDAGTNTVSGGTVTYTTQAVTPLTAPEWGDITAQSWPVGVPVTLDLCTFLTTPGIPPATVAVQAGALPTGIVFVDSCTIGGIPNVADDYTATIRATNSEGTDDADLVVEVTQEDTGGTGPVSCADIPNQYLEVGDVVNLDLNEYCTNVDSYECSVPAAGIERTGGVFSGTVTTIERKQTQCQASNAFETANPRITWIVGEVCAKVDHSPAPSNYVTAQCPKKRGKVWNDGVWE